MSSSTSSSEPATAPAPARIWPRALIAAIALAAGVELIVAATAPSYMESQPIIYEAKLGGLAGEMSGEVVIFGDSTAVAAVKPEAIEPAFPEAWRVSNLAMPGSGPVVAEYVLQRIVDDERIEPPKLVVLTLLAIGFAMAWLAHGESRGYHLEFSALIGEAELAEAIEGSS